MFLLLFKLENGIIVECQQKHDVRKQEVLENCSSYSWPLVFQDCLHIFLIKNANVVRLADFDDELATDWVAKVMKLWKVEYVHLHGEPLLVL